MDGIGSKLRARARALGLSDAEVARQLGLSPSRYTNYVSGIREPDFATFLRICQVLQATPNDLLGMENQASSGSSPEVLRQHIAAAIAVMDVDTLRLAAEMMNVLAARIPKQRAQKPER